MTAHRAHPRQSANAAGLQTSLRDCGHLLRRAGFGATPADVLTAAKGGVGATIARLVDYDSIPDTVKPLPPMVPEGRAARADALTVWWLYAMIHTSRPLQEKLTLFWHGHFATGIGKVRSPYLMALQNATFRKYAAARFDDLLSAVYKDPAMLVWLDGGRNTKAAPNENFGREVMELFVLGRGNYTEDDVHAMARAFTGWQVNRDTGAVNFNPRLHDDGVKTILGQTGNWGSDDAVRILAAHPAAGRWVAGRLWAFFASDSPPPGVVDRLASVYVSSDHSIREVVRALLSSPEFYGAAVRNGHIKSPVEYVVSPIVQLGLPNVDLTQFPQILTALGQTLFDPPNVGGWPGGTQWINAATMLARFTYASRLTGDAPGSIPQFDVDALLVSSEVQTGADLLFWLADALGVSLTSTTFAALARYAGTGTLEQQDAPLKLRGTLHLALVSPEYQAT